MTSCPPIRRYSPTIILDLRPFSVLPRDSLTPAHRLNLWEPTAERDSSGKTQPFPFTRAAREGIVTSSFVEKLRAKSNASPVEGSLHNSDTHSIVNGTPINMSLPAMSNAENAKPNGSTKDMSDVAPRPKSKGPHAALNLERFKKGSGSNSGAVTSAVSDTRVTFPSAHEAMTRSATQMELPCTPAASTSTRAPDEQPERARTPSPAFFDAKSSTPLSFDASPVDAAPWTIDAAPSTIDAAPWTIVAAVTDEQVGQTDSTPTKASPAAQHADATPRAKVLAPHQRLAPHQKLKLRGLTPAVDSTDMQTSQDSSPSAPVELTREAAFTAAVESIKHQESREHGGSHEHGESNKDDESDSDLSEPMSPIFIVDPPTVASAGPAGLKTCTMATATVDDTMANGTSSELFLPLEPLPASHFDRDNLNPVASPWLPPNQSADGNEGTGATKTEVLPPSCPTSPAAVRKPSVVLTNGNKGHSDKSEASLINACHPVPLSWTVPTVAAAFAPGEIFVGPLFGGVHKSVLGYYSHVAVKATDAELNTVVEDPLFGVFRHWVFGRQLSVSTDDKNMAVNAAIDLKTLFQLWRFGARIQAPLFVNYVSDVIMAKKYKHDELFAAAAEIDELLNMVNKDHVLNMIVSNSIILNNVHLHQADYDKWPKSLLWTVLKWLALGHCTSVGTGLMASSRRCAYHLHQAGVYGELCGA